MVVAFLYEMQSPCNCFTLSLCVSDSCRSNSWRDNLDATTLQWRSRCQAGDDGDHDGALEMEIMSHILITCDVYLLCILFFLERR